MYSVHVTFSCHKNVIYIVNLFSPFAMLCGSTDMLLSETCYYILVCKVLINGKKWEKKVIVENLIKFVLKGNYVLFVLYRKQLVRSFVKVICGVMDCIKLQVFLVLSA